MSTAPPPHGVRFTEDREAIVETGPVDIPKLPRVMERVDIANNDSDGSGSSDGYLPGPHHGDDSFEGTQSETVYTPTSTTDNFTPLTGLSNVSSWNSNIPQRPRVGSGSAVNGKFEQGPEAATNGFLKKVSRPTGPARTPSSTYQPARRPPQYISIGNRQRSSSASRARRDPNAQYRAQEKAYVRRLRQDPSNEYFDETYPASVGYSTESETEDESPASEVHNENDTYDQETLLYYNNDESQPSQAEMNIPENRERLEWHSMLASVLTGDVVKQEKKRLIGASEQQGENSRQTELWIGIRSKVCGRSLAAQRRVIEDGRASLASMIDSIASFEIKGEKDAGKSAWEQVRDMVSKIEKCEALYPTRLALKNAQSKAASEAYQASCDAVLAWHNTTELINTELAILQAWVGNEELDISKARDPTASPGGLSDESTFIERILKEDGLQSLQDSRRAAAGGKGFEHRQGMLRKVVNVIEKAKETLIHNAQEFADRHLPPYIEELLILINFPSRLIQEIIRTRLSYTRKMKDPATQVPLMADQMIAQFQILLKLAVAIKNEYTVLAQPEPGWNLPPCIDESFDHVVLDALKFYFKMLNAKLSGNKNAFKEAEILEQEWEFSNEIGRSLDGGDVEVAEQFSSLTAKSLSRLSVHFERELQRRPDETAADMEKRFKSTLDSVRVRQRKLFRFSRLLGQRFENSTELSINMSHARLQALYAALIATGHFLVYTASVEHDGLWLVASPSLYDRPRDIQSILGTCFHEEDAVEDPSNPYVLILRPERPLYWDGRRIDVDMREPPMDLKAGRLRLVADGSQTRLASAKHTFAQFLAQATSIELDTLIEQRANLPRVNAELSRIKRTAYKLSNTILDKVADIRKQTEGLECQDLIQTTFAFATEFGQRSLTYMDNNRRAMNNMKLTRLAIDWVSFICDDCVASDRKTFKWAVVALEFAMVRTRGQNILSISDDEYSRLRAKVGGCMSLLISHFDIMGARSTIAAQAEKQRIESLVGQFSKMDPRRLKLDDETSQYVRDGYFMNCDHRNIKNDEEAMQYVRDQWLEQLTVIDEMRKQKEAERQALGKVLEESNEADRSLTYLSSSATNVTLRWQQGQYVGGGTFGSVYAAINLDSGYLMAVKEIRLQDPQLIPMIAQQIMDEMGVLEVLDHPNIVSYYGIEPHRDKVYIFMEYCSGGSLAGLLEHGRIEDETVIMVYALQMLEGLAYLHQSGIVHRDIKPENILLDHNGVIKYVDFGAAKIIARQGKTLAGNNSSRGEKQKSMTGTPMYMSPEVIKGTSEGRLGAVDIWSLGCVILEMATGRRPWASLDNEWAIMYNIAQGKPPQLPTHEQLSASGIDFLQKCFERDANKRSTAAELLQHDWIMTIRSQVAMEPATPSDTSSTRGSVSS